MRCAKKTPEGVITAQIRYALNLNGIVHWKQWQGIGSAPGVSDIIGCLPGGRMLAIEVKTEKGKVSVPQQNFIDRVNAAGGLAFVARSIDDVTERLNLKGTWRA